MPQCLVHLPFSSAKARQTHLRGNRTQVSIYGHKLGNSSCQTTQMMQSTYGSGHGLDWICLTMTHPSYLVPGPAITSEQNQVTRLALPYPDPYQATSHYLNQCWPRSMSPYGATRPQWVKPLRLSATRKHSITWANVDLDPCHHIVPLGHNELSH